MIFLTILTIITMKKILLYTNYFLKGEIIMKIKSVCFLLFVALTIILIGCDGKESPINPESSVGGLSFLGTVGGMCDKSALSKTISLQKDSVDVYITKDLVRVVAGVDYNCGTQFETTCTIKDKMIQMYIRDVCPDPSNCYNRCKCNYMFEFQFAREGKIDYNYSVELKSPLPNQSAILSEGLLEAK